MAGSLNKAGLIDAYVSGSSLPEISSKFGVPVSTARYHILKAGVLRTRKEGIGLAKWKISKSLKGRTCTFSQSRKNAISNGRRKWADEKAKGTSVKRSGYVEYTRRVNKFRSVHVVAMETRIGRRLLPDEVVHHIDGDRSNNCENNLALMTRGGHARCHRREDLLAGKSRERDQNGRFR